MNNYIYKFWENNFFSLDKGQKQIEDMTGWIMDGMNSFEELSENYGEFYNMDVWSKEMNDYMKVWETTTEDFQKLFRSYLDVMGVVPRDDYLGLLNKYKELDESIKDQKKEISIQEKLIAGQKKEVSKQKDEISNQKKLIADLKKGMTGQKKIVAVQKKEISKQKDIIASQKKEITAQKKIVTALKKEVTGNMKSIKRLQAKASA